MVRNNSSKMMRRSFHCVVVVSIWSLVDPLCQDSILAVSNLGFDGVGGHGNVLGEIHDVFPGEVLQAVFFERLTSEMAVSGGLVVLGFTQGKRLGQGTRTGVEVDLDDVGNKLGGQAFLFGSVGLDEDTERLGDTNGIRQLDQSAFAQSRLDNGLGHPTAGVGSRSVNLGRILSGESTSTMGTPSTVSINDNLTSGQTGITLGSTDDELSRGVDVKVACGTVVNAQGRVSTLELDALQSGLDDVFVD
mmetsp:Transcript_10218/g.21084  ORF Transcript_10218/g.21084 Transcript_10218/m.21084 type:complete len:247 (+) Transcript_10218:79-819(+)